MFCSCSVRHNEKEVEISRQNFVQYHDLAAFFLSGQWCYGTAASIFLCLARPLPLPLQPPALHTYKLKVFYHWNISLCIIRSKTLAYSFASIKDFFKFFSVSFWELSHLTHDLSQTEKKINVVTSWVNLQNDMYFTQNGWKSVVEVVNLSKKSCHFVSCSAFNNSYFLLSLR